MKITRIEAIPVDVPLKPDVSTKTAHGDHVTSPYVMLRVHTDEGLCGLGEATLAPRWSGESQKSCLAAIEEFIAPALIGEDSSQIRRLLAVMNRVVKRNPFTKAAIEMALWDLAGKRAGRPVYELLGGTVRDEIPIKLVVGAFPISKAVSLAERFLEMGVRHLKVKVGLNPEEDLARVAAVRRVAGPDVTLGIDANCGWDRSTARHILPRLSEYNLLFAEQPIPPDFPEYLTELRSVCSVPIMADESLFTPADALTLIKLRAADIFSIYPGKHAGILPTLDIASIARTAGIPCSIGSNLELGVGTAAMLHVAAASDAIDSERFPADLIGPFYHESDLLTEPLQLGPPVARVPTRPGLGVEFDDNLLEKYRS